MKINSTLINDEEFKWVKNSILNADSIDGEGSFRVSLVEYINDTADNDDDKYFYDMLPFVRFLTPGSDAIAYTDESKRIFLNAPCQHIGKNFKQWDFTFDHECLHQLWDTFGVKDKIIANGYEYNHMVLNIASDCVINDYLSHYRRKEQAPNTITPRYLSEQFGVEYDRNIDTQYTLYLKLIEKKDNIEKDPVCQQVEGKIKPKEVRKKKGPTPPPPPPPKGKHSKDFIKGWTDAIKDVVGKKVDPTDPNLKPKNTGNEEYDAGYNAAINNMKKGIEDGIDINTGGGGGKKGPQSDLPQIPWDIDDKSDNNDGSGGTGKDDSDNKDSSSKKSAADSAKKSASDAQNAADAAKEAADAAQKAADAAKEAGDENADDMQDAADKAAEAADKAQRAADKASDAAEEAAGAGDDTEEANDAAKRADKAAKEAADAAKEAADAAKEAGDLGEESDDSDTHDAAKKAQNAAKKAQNASDKANGDESGDDNNNSDSNDQNDSDSSTQKPGTGHIAPVESTKDLEKLKKDAADVINEYKNKIAGDLGEFLAKCKSSVKLEKDGLAAHVTKGVKGWNVELDNRINKFVKQKVFQKKRQWQSTYSRIRRGTGYVKIGEPLQPGRRVKDDTMIINVAFYIDRSGSMSGSLDTVFNASYEICEALKKKYRKEKVVEDVIFKILAFDDRISEVKYGNKTTPGGGTMSMSQLMKSIKQYSNNYLINVVITDGYFEINDSEVKKFINDVNGIVVYIVNRDFPEMEKLANQLKTKLFFIRADGNFKIK